VERLLSKRNILLIGVIILFIISIAGIIYYTVPQQGIWDGIASNCDHFVSVLDKSVAQSKCNSYISNGYDSCSVKTGYSAMYDYTAYLACAIKNDDSSNNYDDTPDESSDSGNCNPSSGYEHCVDGYSTYGSATSSVKLQLSGLYGQNKNGKWYVADDFEMKYSGDCDYLYLYDNYRKSQCGENGCNGYITKLSSSGTIRIADYTPLQPAFVCWDRKDKGGYWSWVYVCWEWDNVWYKSDFKCNNDDDCGNNQYCGTIDTGSECMELGCGPTEDVINHQCTNVEMPEICQEAGITNIYTCKDYIIEFADILANDLQGKIDTIAQLDLDYQEKLEMIINLSNSIEQQDYMIAEFELTITDLAQEIQDLNWTVQQQIEYIRLFNLTIDEYAADINRLTDNLAIKAQLVAGLKVENAIQAELVKKITESFANQGAILAQLNLTVQDDAEIIQHMTDNAVEQGQIIAGMELNLDEQIEIVTEMTKITDRQLEIIAELTDNQVIQNQLIDKLQEKTDIDDETIQALKKQVLDKQQETKTYIKASIIISIILITIIGGMVIYWFIKKKR